MDMMIEQKPTPKKQELAKLKDFAKRLKDDTRGSLAMNIALAASAGCFAMSGVHMYKEMKLMETNPKYVQFRAAGDANLQLFAAKSVLSKHYRTSEDCMQSATSARTYLLSASLNTRGTNAATKINSAYDLLSDSRINASCSANAQFANEKEAIEGARVEIAKFSESLSKELPPGSVEDGQIGSWFRIGLLFSLMGAAAGLFSWFAGKSGLAKAFDELRSQFAQSK